MFLFVLQTGNLTSSGASSKTISRFMNSCSRSSLTVSLWQSPFLFLFSFTTPSWKSVNKILCSYISHSPPITETVSPSFYKASFRKQTLAGDPVEHSFFFTGLDLNWLSSGMLLAELTNTCFSRRGLSDGLWQYIPSFDRWRSSHDANTGDAMSTF